MLQHETYLMSNMNLLKERGISNYELVALDTELPPTITIDQTRTNILTVKYKDTLLHSLYDPLKEAKRFIDSQNIAKGDHVLLYGFGLGYHVRELLEQIGVDGKLIIFEPNFDVLNAALILVDLRKLFAHHDILIIAGKKEDQLAMRLSSFLTREFSQMSDEKKKVVIHMPSYQCFPEHLTGIKESFDLLLLERKASEVFGDLEKENFIKNLDIMLASPNIDVLKKIFSGKPAVLMSAGPSLDIALEHVRKYVDNAFIFAADTAYPFLQKAEIVPDVVFSVDPQADTIKHFPSTHDDRALLIGLPTMDAYSLQKYSGPKMCIMQKDNSVTKKLEPFFRTKSFTFAGGAVSCIALDVMFQLGCDPIIFVGMDYAFPFHKFYSTNTVEMKKWYREVNRFNTVEMMHYDVIEERKIRYIDGAQGKKVPTHGILYLYLRQIEGIISRNPKTQIYNFMSQGAKIQGAGSMLSERDLSKVLKRKIDKEYIAIDLSSIDREIKERILSNM